MRTRRDEFLAGDHLDHVAIYLAEEHVDDPDGLDGHVEDVEDGIVLVVEGAVGRDVFSAVVGLDPMGFAQEAMSRPGSIDGGLCGGDCPAGSGPDHRIRYVLAFAEAQNEQAGGRYAEGDVVHAYARCACGESFSDRWVANRNEA